MTMPCFRPPGYAYEGTNRYRDSRIYTPPDPVIIAAYLTIVAKFQKIYDVAILAYCLMGTHDHLIPIDRDPNSPSRTGQFKQQVHACMAKFLQCYWDLPDDPVYSEKIVGQLFPILDHDRVVEKIAYVEMNFVKAGLVRSNDELPPGAVSTREMMRTPLVVKRPDVWFRPNKWPDEVEIRLEVPDYYLEREGLSEAQFVYQTSMECFREHYDITKERTEEEREVVGLERLLDQTPYAARSDEKSTKIVLFTGNDPTQNAQFYLRYRRFLRSYSRAIGRVREGRHDTVFPFGTCKMALSYGFRMYVPPG